MLWPKRSTFLIFFLIGLAPGTFASEGGGHEKKEAPKEEGAPAPTTSKEAVEYGKKEARLNTLRSRIDEANKRFKETVEAMNHSRDERARQGMTETLATIDKERKENMKELTALQQELIYQYPSKGKPINRKFKPDESRKEPETEASASGLDAQLTETKRRIDKKYAPLIPKEDLEAQAAKSAPAHPVNPHGKSRKTPLDSANAPKKLRLER